MTVLGIFSNLRESNAGNYRHSKLFYAWLFLDKLGGCMGYLAQKDIPQLIDLLKTLVPLKTK